MINIKELRRKVIQQAIVARKEYFRLRRELAALEPVLPESTCIATYRSKCVNGSTGYKYFMLKNKHAVFPSAQDSSRLTTRLHLGMESNSRFLRGCIDLEQTRIYQIKLQTFERVASHYTSLKKILALLRSLKRKGYWQIKDSREYAHLLTPAQHKSILDFLKS